MNFQPVWIEIPVSDINRAAKFYGALLGRDLEIRDDGVRKTTTLTPSDFEGCGISINETKDFRPSKDGVFLYVDADGDIDAMLEKVKQAGGTVTTPKTSMGDAGSYGAFLDTEGNTLSFWAMG
jgi:uncharacterized protein